MTHAWLTQVVGRKRFTLIPPCDLWKVFDCNGFGTLFSENSDRFPCVSECRQYSVVLHPGDTLFVPAGWAHVVECIDDSISVTFNFLPESNFSAIRAAYLAYKMGKVRYG